MTNSVKRYFIFVFSIALELIYSNNSSVRSGQIVITNAPVKKILITENWFFKTGDNMAFAKTDFNDSKWDTVNAFLGEKAIKKFGFTGRAWFRLHLVFDSVSELQTYVFNVFQKGASEIYFNGRLVKRIGSFGTDQNYDTGEYDPLYLTPVAGKENVIAIRYENLGYEHSYNSSGDLMGGFYCSIEKPERYFADVMDEMESASVYGMGLFSFFFSIGLIHFLLFIFYRARKSNLLFSIFCFLFSYYFLHYFLTTTLLSDPSIKSLLVAFFVITVPFFFLALLSVLYSLFYEKNPKLLKYLFFASLTCSILLMTIQSVGYFFGMLLVLTIVVEVIRVIIVAIRKKKRGAKIISTGFGAFAIFLSMIFLSMLFNDGSLELVGGSVFEQVFFIAFILAIISIPLSMSTFLAWDFAQTNKTLSKKLIEVEDLSAKSIEQEKEKQKILAEQNVVLEIQVKERTSEINEQKKVIEEKNKDITDSINYAQRIQRSILPSENEINDIFEESFVLFKPRDIVSGDFYQFKKNGDYRYAILADCTGHGVPGALMSMIGSNLLKQIILERGTKEPNKILSELHKEVRSTLRQTSGVQSHDGMDASVVLLHNEKLFIASANRPVYIVNNGELTELKPDKRSIGGSQSTDEIEFALNEMEIRKGMMVYLFSDGYADQFGGEAGKKFKVKNLSHLLLSIYTKPLNTQKEILDTTFNNWKQQLEQVDDVSLIGIRF